MIEGQKKNLVNFFILFVFCTNLESVIYYIINILLVLIVLFYEVLVKQKIKPFALIDYIPLFFILIWVYGVILGIIRGNNPDYIVANFAGMVMYSSYYLFLYSNLALKALLRSIIIASIFNVLLAFVFYALFFVFYFDYNLLSNSFFFKNFKPLEASTGQVRLFWGGLLILYPALGMAVMIFFKGQPKKFYILSKIISLLSIFVSIGVLFFVSASKGFLLGIILLFVFIFFSHFLYIEKSFAANYEHRQLSIVINKKIWILLVFALMFIVFMVTFEFDNIYQALSNVEDQSNAIRYEQLGYILGETNIIGNGLGACLKSGYNRGTTIVTSCYGFELTYINLFHKFGLLALVLIIMYIYTFVKAWRVINNKNNNINYISIPIAALMFTMPSIGNPMLFSPTSVMLHCISLYCIKKLDI